MRRALGCAACLTLGATAHTPAFATSLGCHRPSTDHPGTGTHNCYRPSGTNGVLSTSNSSYAPAYRTGTGWDFATGIGTVNAFNLVMGWP
jgi:hypothetical protein